MTKHGTCAYCVLAGTHRRHPHEPSVEVYMCVLADLCDMPPPPPIARVSQEVGFLIHAKDCDACHHYAAAGGPQLGKLLSSRKRALRRPRNMRKVRAKSKARTSNA